MTGSSTSSACVTLMTSGTEGPCHLDRAFGAPPGPPPGDSPSPSASASS
ncbi:hypothetical protein ACGFY7_09645 [Streptomyces prunicolor]